MTFKDIVKSDIRDAFFNPEEFAGRNSGSPHIWDGVPILAILDDMDLQVKYSAEYQSMPAGTLLVFIPVSEISLPVINSVHRFDGNFYTIWGAREEQGVYVIALVAGNA